MDGAKESETDSREFFVWLLLLFLFVDAHTHTHTSTSAYANYPRCNYVIVATVVFRHWSLLCLTRSSRAILACNLHAPCIRYNGEKIDLHTHKQQKRARMLMLKPCGGVMNVIVIITCCVPVAYPHTLNGTSCSLLCIVNAMYISYDVCVCHPRTAKRIM